MKTLILVLSLVLSSACATSRTLKTDQALRVGVEAHGLSRSSYMRLTKALVSSHKFQVIERAQSLRTIASEQEIEHTTTRFDAKEKYAGFSKLYGVGAIISVSEQCASKNNLFGYHIHCIENLNLISSTTGEILSSAEVSQNTDEGISPEWSDAVEELIANHPSKFIDSHDQHKTVDYDDALVEYREKTIPKQVKPEMKMNPEDRL